jgi:hypothetical protein
MTQTGNPLMAQAPRHAAPGPARSALLRAGLTVTALGAALSAGAGAAQAAPVAAPPAGVDRTLDDTAAPVTPGQALVGAVLHSAAGGIGPATSMRLDPLAGTAIDPLDNVAGAQVADFRPLSTEAATEPLANGGGLKDLPVAGRVTGLLPG